MKNKMKQKRMVSFLLTLSLVFSMLTGTVFGASGLNRAALQIRETVTTSSNMQVTTQALMSLASNDVTDEVAYVRIEGDTDTFVRRIAVPLEPLDLSQYGASKECEGVSVLEVILRALEAQGLDAKDSNVIEHGGGSFISSVCGLGTGSMSGWMYTLNGVSPQYGVNQQAVKADDEIVLYYIEDWTASSYAHFDTEYKEVTQGESFELVLNNDALDMWTWETKTVPTEKAEILLDDKVLGTTDELGKMTLTFNEAGTYYLSAKKIENDINIISRPYCEVKVEAKPDFDYQSAMQTAQSWIQNQIDFSTYKYKVNSTPDWQVLALSRSGITVPDSYFEGMEAMVKSYESTEAFKAAMKKVTEYERMTIGITASGHDATDVAGVDFIEAIYNSDILTKQGTNGVVYGLLAVDAHNYEVPSDALYTREKMVDLLLENHISNGGWGFTLGATKSDIDLTAMAVQALTPYYKDSNFAKNKEVRQVVDEALDYLGSVQEENGMYKAYGNYNPESMSQVIVALSGLGIDCQKDARFIKNGCTLINALEGFYNQEDGGFKHTLTGKTNSMATQQTLYGLAAYERFLNGQNNLYDMTDIVLAQPIQNEMTLKDGEQVALTAKHQNVAIEVEDDFKQIGVDLTQVANNVPNTTITFGTQSIYLPQGVSLNTPNKVLKLQPVDVSTLESYKAELENAKAIESAFDFGNESNVTFSEFITLTFKNGKDLAAAYIDEAGKLYPIAKNPVDLTGLSEYCIVDGEDLVVKTNHLTTFLSYSQKESVTPEAPSAPEVPSTPEAPETSEDENGSGSGSGSETPEAQIQVTISVDAKTIDKGYIVPTKKITIKEGATAFEALESLNLDLDVVGSDENVYVAAINGLGEFDHGALSGWMYNVNGEYPNVGLGNYTLSQGDVMEVRYTTNGGKDLGDDASSLIGGSDSNGGSNNGSGGGGGGSTSTATNEAYKEAINEVTALLADKETVSEWELIGLARQNKLSETAKKQLIEKVTMQKGDYRKVTDLERMIIALGAAGYDAQNVNGINLVEKLYNRDSVTSQGANGVIFALIALDSKQYDVPTDSKWTREKLIKTLFTYQNEDGGFALAIGDESNVDLTAMALSALAQYQSKQKASIEKAINYLAKVQDVKGEYSYAGITSSESTAQVIIALSELGIDVAKDSRFIKGDKNLIDVLMNYYVDEKGFKHVLDESVNQMATEQALLALLSYERYLANEAGIYSYEAVTNSEDVVAKEDQESAQFEAFKDHEEVAAWAKDAMEEAISLGFVQGSNKLLHPKDQVTRAEFVTMLLKVLGDEVVGNDKGQFEDVKDDAWYSKAVNTAYSLKLVEGMSDTQFMPNAAITREQMAVILERMMDETSEGKAPSDLETVSTWAKDAVLEMYANGMMQGADGKFEPKQAVTREMSVVILMRYYAHAQEVAK